ncbi:DUF1304 domain-containing protein [Streptococcus ratti]|uniref:Integral membrane protein n=1 Tax=Streptococcus ratti FA-1 = DSM 20564 TaxID=699248 RepID=A0ABN0GU75_STRRT|nr:DUF1304 family protein [Streptococcus ratti]EJN93789.1 hypothetical protein SRA_04606 [Streptococcus ratti FA-1 = DSM 20564]EMP67823.1 hypothetical protein D822_09545 [Streptococcus ratti FA-1 = DSM 20564]QEY07640.1 DUF1304 family protein [Streptococcus ratti]VEI60101.1 integral membrane protein [Streptococcus mutans]
MSIIKSILVILIALEFFYIMYLETLATQSAKTAQVFGMSQEKLAEKEIDTLFKNQGIYNGLLGLGLLYGLIFNASLILPILVYIILVAAYGAYSSNPKILLTQGGLAIITAVLYLF